MSYEMTSLISVASTGEGDTVVLDGLGDKQMGETVQVVIQPNGKLHYLEDDVCQSFSSDDGSLLATPCVSEPATKRARTDDFDVNVDQNQSIKSILFSINKAICLRLDAIENKLETVVLRTKYLEQKVELISSRTGVTVLDQSGAQSPGKSPTPGGRRSSAVIVGLPQEKVPNGLGSSPSGIDQGIQALGPNVTLITLNSEDDFPTGTWLGDETNPEMRVRAPITPSDLLHIHSNCRTAEKMALSLLDYLFDRDTQACSNLSGMGKHGKKQLDPLMVYGIRCHLIHRFGITEQDWHRIKQNIDSKCRTAFRRKVRGMPLTVKAFRGKAPPTYVHVLGDGVSEYNGSHLGEMGSASEDSMNHEDAAELQIHEEVDLQHAGVMQATTAAELIQSAGGHIQVLHATPEQVAQLQHTHQIQILQGDQVMQLGGESSDGIHVAVSMAQQDGIQVISTDTGETVHIKTDPGCTDDDLGVVCATSGEDE